MSVGHAVFYRLGPVLDGYTIWYLRPLLLTNSRALLAFLMAASQTGYQLFTVFSLRIIDILINRLSTNADPSML